MVYDPTVAAFISQLNAQVAALTTEQIKSNKESIWAKLGQSGRWIKLTKYKMLFIVKRII